MQNTKRTWTVADFSAWVAGNPDLPSDGFLTRAEGVDISRPGTLSLSRAFVPVEGATLDAAVAFVLAVSNLPDTVNPYVLAFLENGKIWRMRRDGSSPTLVYTDPDGAISQAAIFAGRLYWTTPTHLNNIVLEGSLGISQNSWTSGVNTGTFVQRTFVNGASSHPIAVFDEGGTQALYVADKNTIARLLYDPANGSYTFTASHYAFDQRFSIADMFGVNSHAIVYTSDYTGTVGSVSERHIMNLVSGLPLSSKRLDGLNVLRAFASSETEYMIGGVPGDICLYEWNGYDVSLSRHLDPTLLVSSLRRPCNIRCDRSHFWLSGAFDGMIHIYGRAYPDVRPGYGQSYGLPDIPPNTDACVTAMATSGDTVVIGGSIYTSPYATHRLYRLSSSSHRSSGVIETVTIAADDPFSRKTVERLRIAHVLPVGTSLSVSFAVDGGIYETIRTIGSDAGTVSIIDPSEFPVGREFSTARLRVELLSESTSATPILRGVSLSYLSHDV